MNEDVKTTVPESAEPTQDTVVTDPAPKPGEKTDPALLLKSLQEERQKVKELEQALQAKESVPENSVITFSGNEGDLAERLARLEAEAASREEHARLAAVQSTYPALKDKAAEFDEFRTLPENAGMRLETAAKAFLVEKDLLKAPAPRKGLEKDTGGGRVQPKEGMSQDEIADLRKNNFREYSKRLRDGTLGA